MNEGPACRNPGVGLQLLVKPPFDFRAGVPAQNRDQPNVGFDAHRTELQAAEGFPVPADPRLDEQDGPSILDPDANRHKQHQRQTEGQQQRSEHEVHKPPGHRSPAAFNRLCLAIARGAVKRSFHQRPQPLYQSGPRNSQARPLSRNLAGEGSFHTGGGCSAGTRCRGLTDLLASQDPGPAAGSNPSKAAAMRPLGSCTLLAMSLPAA
jgi:hypothetical protein